MMRRTLKTLLVILATALMLAPPPPVRGQVSPDVIEQTVPRIVKLLSPVGKIRPGSNQFAGFGCSGSFIASSGYILTASHCVRATEDNRKQKMRKGQLYNPEGLTIVAVNVEGQDLPVPMMWAKRVEDIPGFVDLALLKVVQLLGQGGAAQPLPPGFRVPVLSLGDPARLRRGEAVVFMGFPGVGGDTLSTNQGFVSGFVVDEKNIRTLVKFDAPGAGQGASGGAIVNARGEQVAIISRGQWEQATAARSITGIPVNQIPEQWWTLIRADQAPAEQAGGGGAQPPAQPTGAGVTLQGRIVDAGTGTGIAGAAFYLLRPGTSLRSATKGDVVASGVTNGNGLFQTQPPVPRGPTYPWIILANGFVRLNGTLTFAASGPGPTVTIKLQRQQ